ADVPAVSADVVVPRPPPPPYALPFQLRPAAVADVVRSDTTIASYQGGTTVASTFLAAARITPSLAPLVRVAVVHDTPTSTSMSNPLLGLTWAAPLGAPLKLAVLGAVTIPVGSGGGNTPDPMRAAASKAGVPARAGMDNALFAVNDVAAIAGVDLAYVHGSFTVQGEVTLFQLTRVRGGDVQPDTRKTNSTAGLFVGWTAHPRLALGAELRYQRWLSTPAAVAADMTGATRDTLTAAIGVRTKIDLGGGRVLKPGLAFAHGLDDPLDKKGYEIVQVDLPFSF
ncbi:MAG TPA: hypothetical protein VL463_04865, partial [Kofleriaceae bacterium]|nr:hypothetical protein [Kofleriaceae bacterium]